MAEFSQQEELDGIRLTWNRWPTSKVEASKCVVPLAAIYTPLRYFPDKQPLPYPPLRCRTCSALLCCYAQIDFMNKLWVCPFCFQRNHFPQQYHHIAPDHLPPELFPQFSTVEYAPPADQSLPPVFLFVLDTCLIEEELGYLKTAMKQAIELLPEHALVGMITFGTQIQVHELGCKEMLKSYIFRGSKDISKEAVLDQLGLSPSQRTFQAKGQQPNGVHGGGTFVNEVSRFLLPQAECEYNLGSLLEDLQRDAWPVQAAQRPMRCTGMALTVASGLLGACVPGTGARIMAFLGGPCTDGPGAIVSKELSDPIRSHKDLDKDAVPFYQKAVKFYQALSKQLVDQGHVLDLFACALDQVGVAEIKVAVEKTGGLVVLAESFGHSVFKESFKRVFEAGENDLGLSFNGMFEVLCSKDVKIQGILGPCASLEKKGMSCSDTVIGQGNTTAWKLCGVDRSTSVAIFFDIVPSEQQSSDADLTTRSQFYLQFLTQYQHSDGKTRIRATTITREWVDAVENLETLIEGFDQEAAAVVLARLTSHKMESEEDFDPTRWLDRLLIRMSSRFGHYQKDDPSSFRFSAKFAIFPQFLFNLRRSQFVQVFNNSPDETAYFRMLLNRENVINSVVMIQPSLITYSMSGPPEPALLDVAAIAADRILLLDTYFSVVVFHGASIAQWRSAGYQNQPEYQSFAELLQAPLHDAQALIAERFPVPRLVVCDQHGSQARFLLAKLNPSATYNSIQGPPPGGDIIFTDDVSLQVFVEHLQKLAVQS